MRQTIYIPSYGYITKDDSFEYIGNGILGDTFNALKDIITSKPVRDMAVNAATSFGSTVAKKGGEKAADKLVDKVFSKKKNTTNNTSETIEEVIDENKTIRTNKQSKDILKKLYGNGLFRQSGNGLRRV